MTRKRWLLGTLLILLCCSGEVTNDGESTLVGKKVTAKGVIGMYESLDGTETIQFRSGAEVEVKDGSDPIILGSYTVEPDGRVRVVAKVLGTDMVMYFKPSDNGLIEESGGDIYYSESSIVQAREEHYCSELAEDVEDYADRLLRSRGRSKWIDLEDSIREISGGSLWGTGIRGAYAVVGGSHQHCPYSLVLDTRNPEDFKRMSRNEENSLLAELNKDASREVLNEEQRIAQEADRKEAERLALIKQSETPTATVGTFSGKIEGDLVEITITDVDVQAPLGGSSEKIAIFGWMTCDYRDFGGSSSLSFSNGYRSGRWEAYKPGVWLGFPSQQERDAFKVALEQAVTTWGEKYAEVHGIPPEKFKPFRCPRN